MARYLIIVARDHPELYEYLKQEFTGDPGVEIILDRRRGERRRQRPDETLRRLGVAVARTQEDAPSG